MTQQTRITSKEAEVLAYIIAFIATRHYPPSMRQIMDGCHMSSTSMVTACLKGLEKAGRIERTAGESRTIVVTEEAQQ